MLIFLFLFFQQKVIHMLFQSSQLAPHSSNCGCPCQTAETQESWLEKPGDSRAPAHTVTSGSPSSTRGVSQLAPPTLGHTGCSVEEEELKRD